MARPLSVCKHFAHVNEQAVIEDMDLNVDKDGVVSVILDVRPYKRHQRRCPHCGKRCVDPFHDVQWAGDALDTMRTQIWQSLRVEARGIEKQIKNNDDPQEIRRLRAEQQVRELQATSIKHSAYTLGKGKENLTSFQSQRLALIAESQPALYKAYQLKEQLRIILKMPIDQVRYFLQKWYWRASHSRSQVIKDLARKIKRHQENIFNTIQNGLSNARIEAINNKIKLLVRRAYGFRNLQNMFAYVKLICSNVDIPLPNRPVVSLDRPVGR